MRQRQQFYQIFVFFTLLTILILIISPIHPFYFITGTIQRIFAPIQRSIYMNLGLSQSPESVEAKSLKDKNLQLISQLAKYQALEKDNAALRDQFAQQDISSQQLLPVEIIGMDTVVPGTIPTQIVINVGKHEQIKKGMAIVYKNILIGIVDSVSEERSTVLLTTNKKISLSAKTVKSGALGILKGDANDMLFDQVLLSEKLDRGDMIITRGDVNEKGEGYPPNLMLGEIIAVNKKPSDLFQSARISPLIDVTRLSTVFVVISQ